MKTSTTVGWAAAAALAVFLPINTAQAQNMILRANVPFEFHAGKQTMPAGDYRIEIDRMAGRVTLLGPANRLGTYLGTPLLNPTPSGLNSAGLVFRKYGQDYFLGKVLSGSVSTSYEWPPSAVEKVLSKRAGLQVAEVRAK